MSYYCRSDRVTNGAGDGLSGYKVRALDLTSGLVVSIYSDESGTPLTDNEATTDSLGNYSFFIAHGVYSEEYLDTAGNRVGYRRYINMVGDPAAQTNAEASATAAAASQTASASSATAAASSASSASTSATSAASSASSASLSASVATAAANMYPDTTAGLAATAEGGYFNVPTPATSNIFATLYREVGGVATTINTSLSGSLITYPNQTNFAGSIALGGGLTKLQVSSYSSEGDYNTFFGIDAGRDLGQGGPWNGNFAFGNTGVGVSVMKVATKAFDNTGMGYEALINLSEGYNNTAIAPKTLYSNTTGYRNVAVGTTALFSNTTTAENTAMGCNSLFYATATGNVALGYGSGWGVSTGNYNTIIGYRAAGSSTGSGIMSSDYCVLVGYRAGYVLTTALDCTLIGRDAAVSLTTGNSNTVVGGSALTSCVTGASNVAIGNGALAAFTGSQTVAIGVSALGANVSAAQTSAVGYQALLTSTGVSNVGFGWRAGFQVTTGANNTFIGTQSGGTTTGSQNTVVGRGAVTAAANSGGVVLGDSASISGDRGIAIGTGTTAGLNGIAIGAGATAAARTGVLSGQDAADLAIGTATNPVAARGDASAYPTAGASLGYARIKLNGTYVKVQIYADA